MGMRGYILYTTAAKQSEQRDQENHSKWARKQKNQKGIGGSAIALKKEITGNIMEVGGVA